MTERKLATVRIIAEVKDIPEADKIQAYRVDGWWVVDSKDKYKVGDMVVYCEPDSWIPHEVAPFLSKGKEPKVYGGIKGERLRIQKLKGQVSQGLLLHVTSSNKESLNWITRHDKAVQWVQQGDDVTGFLGIAKWEPALPLCLAGDARGLFPAEIPKTAAERIQNIQDWESIREQEFEVTEKLHGCFRANQYIETINQGTVQIKDIVDNNLRPILIGVDTNGNIVPCEIVNVFNNGKKKDWITVHHEPYLVSSIVGKSGKLVTTPNHKIFLDNMKEVSAIDLNNGDKILMQELRYCDNAMHYFKSSLLGDGSTGGNGHYSYNEAHAVKYSEYNEYISMIFKDVPTSFRVQTSGYGSQIRHFKAFKTTQLRNMRNEWYPAGKKVVPQDISWMDDFSIAKWYMDDGSLSKSDKQNDRACFATNAFCKDDVERLVNKLKELYCVDAVMFFAKGWRIRVNYCKGTIHNLWERISKHIPPAMRYKLPKEYHNSPFEPYPVAKLQRQFIPVNVLKVEHNDTEIKESGYTAYDIETSTNNYFCGGILVHNSSCTLHLDETGDFHVCSRNLDLKESEGNAYWKAAKKYNVEENMKLLDFKGYAIQGEIIGEGLNGNQYKTSLDFLVFNIYCTKSKSYVSAEVRKDICAALNLNHVPVLQLQTSGLSVQEMLEQADGESLLNGSKREGYVLKSRTDTGLIIKVVSNLWLYSTGN